MSNIENIVLNNFNDGQNKILMSIKKYEEKPNNIILNKNQMENFFEIIEEIENKIKK